MFKLFEHSKYIIIYMIVNLCNFDSFPNCSILKNLYCSKLNNFRNIRICFLKLQNSGNFSNCKFFWFSELQIFEDFRIDFFFHLLKCKCLEFSKLKFFRIFQIWSSWNCPNWKIKKFRDFFSIWRIKVWLQKLAIL